ncbi:MAG: DM13 domain-containing protein [Chloroflexia bacterium]
MLLEKARRNPIFLVVVGLVLVIALAFAWWTISPLFIRTSLVEGQNITVPEASNSTTDTTSMATPTLTNDSMGGATDNMEGTASPENTPTPTTADGDSMSGATEDMESPTESTTEEQAGESMEPAGPMVLATGTFDRKDSVHYADGQAILAREADGSHVIRLQDLDAANGPDLYVYVSEHSNPQSSDELHMGEHNLGSLKATNGSFSYTLDASIDPARIKSVVIYCKAFSVLFSTAPLQASQ